MMFLQPIRPNQNELDKFSKKIVESKKNGESKITIDLSEYELLVTAYYRLMNR
ncbi:MULTISPECIES: hypothetical protein [Bacillus]|uniref:hypothetical protein n=1 Tax=Bacillus TaxID=1386 RepID=UPI002FBDBE29